MVLTILQYIACALTILVGAWSLFSPASAGKFTGLTPKGGRGITEIRAALGMFFVALGLFPILFPTDATFQMLGFAYLLVGIARLISIFVDKSGNQSNWISAVSEFVLGIVLVL
ncbi:MAG: DUF4345 family protein [Chloroflexi bacterium]|nr:DUF4345 family protein [Chloroflexota bacterium]